MDLHRALVYLHPIPAHFCRTLGARLSNEILTNSILPWSVNAPKEV